jgi:hypothetical protein
VQEGAEQVFERLAPGVEPRAVLIGILKDQNPEKYPVCIEPEPRGSDGIPLDAFHDVREQAERLREQDPERGVKHTLEEAQRGHDEWVRRRALLNAIASCLDEHAPQSEYFIGGPQPVGDYMVSTVICVAREQLNARFRLSRSEIAYGRTWWIPKSLLDAAIQELLEVCAQALSPDASSISMDADEVIRRAGSQLMSVPASAAARRPTSGRGLLEACNVVSMMRYEGSEGRGRLVVARKGHPCVETVVTLRQPVLLREHRAVRKLVQIAGGDLHLLADDRQAYGFGRLAGLYDSTQEDLFEVEFVGYYEWDLNHAGQRLMRVSYGRPWLPAPRLARAGFDDVFARIFPDIPLDAANVVWGIIGAAMEQKHGTTIVVSAAAAQEANRLSSQSTPIEPTIMTPELVKRLSCIDGAILIDPRGEAHAVGVILDGQATPKVTPTRGARYNSAVRYVESVNGGPYTACAVVVSEDGSVDLLPNIRPRVNGSVIQALVAELALVTSPDDFEAFGRYHEIMRELDDSFRFYLSSEQCDVVNAAQARYLNRPYELGEIRVPRPAFEPDPMMDSFYILPD